MSRRTRRRPGTPLAPADLQVTSVVGAAPNYSGEGTSVTWTVKNFGAAAWAGTRYWIDDVYFSRYPTYDPNLVAFIGEFPHSNDQPLAAGASYTSSAGFDLPKGIGGTAANPQPENNCCDHRAETVLRGRV